MVAFWNRVSLLPLDGTLLLLQTVTLQLTDKDNDDGDDEKNDAHKLLNSQFAFTEQWRISNLKKTKI